MQPGSSVSVHIDALPDYEFKGEVLAVEPQIDEATRNFKVRARLPNADLKLRPGQFGKVRLTLPGERNLLVVPRTAVSYNSYGTSVFVVQKMKTPAPKPEKPMPGMPPHTDLEVVQRFIKTGDARGDYVAVVEGLKEGEQVADLRPAQAAQRAAGDHQQHAAAKTELDPTRPRTDIRTDMHFTDIFINRPVLATVVSLFILLFGLRAGFDLTMREYPELQNAQITISVFYPGADPP